MSPHELGAARSLFNAHDPYERHAYGLILDILLDADEYDPHIPGRVQEQEEHNRYLLGPRRAALITAQAVMDEIVVRKFQDELREISD